MGLSNYDILGPRTTTLITHAARRTAWRHGLSAADRADLQQEMYLAVIQRATRFDPARGAISTFVATVVRRRADDLGDYRFAARRNPRRCDAIGAEDDVALDHRERRAAQHTDLRLDVGDALASLAPPTRHIAEHLKSDSIVAVARAMNMTRGQVRRQVALLRERFAELRLDPEGAAA